jgi:hypothetical protein
MVLSTVLCHAPQLTRCRFDCICNMVKSIPLFGGFPWIIHIVNLIPMSWLFWLIPSGQVFANFRKFSLACIHEAIRVKENNDRKGIKTEDRGSIFLHLANSDMPASERSPERLVKEAQVLLAGGTATTSHTLGFVCPTLGKHTLTMSRLQLCGRSDSEPASCSRKATRGAAPADGGMALPRPDMG